MTLQPPPHDPGPLDPDDPNMTAEHADVELLALNMRQHRQEVNDAAMRLDGTLVELALLPASALADVDAFDLFRAVEYAAGELARRAHEGAAHWHRWLHGEDSDL